VEDDEDEEEQNEDEINTIDVEAALKSDEYKKYILAAELHLIFKVMSFYLLVTVAHVRMLRTCIITLVQFFA